MPSLGVSVLCRAAAATGAVIAACGGAIGQVNIGPSLGTVELRWRERSTTGYNGSYTIGPWVTPGVDVVPTPDPSAASVTTQDASVVLVLEAKVTQAAGLSGNPIRGLGAASFDIATNQTSGGAFARQVVLDGFNTLNPRANARVNATNLGFNPSVLPGHTASARSVPAPFRSILSTTNGPTMGPVSADGNVITKPVMAAQTGYFEPSGDPEDPPPLGYEYLGLNSWVPIYVVIYTITDVTTVRDIVITTREPLINQDGATAADYNFRTWRGEGNVNNDFADRWQLTPAFTTPPTFTVHVVPGPGAAGVLSIGSLALVRRRRHDCPA